MSDIDTAEVRDYARENAGDFEPEAVAAERRHVAAMLLAEAAATLAAMPAGERRALAAAALADARHFARQERFDAMRKALARMASV